MTLLVLSKNVHWQSNCSCDVTLDGQGETSEFAAATATHWFLGIRRAFQFWKMVCQAKRIGNCHFMQICPFMGVNE